jgi:molybdopterin converting factor subunit 1
MRVRVLYFAVVRELVCREDEIIELPETVRTVKEFASFIAARHPALGGRMESVRVARNEEFTLGEEALADGDVLALIPPVAGG